MRIAVRGARRILFAAAALCVMALPVAPAFAQDAADQAAVDKAAASVKWMDNFTCPSLGLPMNVKGMQSDAEIATQQNTGWSYAQARLDGLRTSLGQREAVLRRAKKTDNYDAELAQFDTLIKASVARAATSLVNWSLANWVELSKVDPAYSWPASGAHPIDRFTQREAKLREFIRAAGSLPGADDFLQSIGTKFHQCLLLAQNQVVERNADSMRNAANAATRSGDVAPIVKAYAVVEPTFAGPGVSAPEVIQALNRRADELQEKERIAAEAEARRLAEAEARRVAAIKPPAGGKQAPAAAAPDADMTAQLRTATALVQALSNKSVSDSLKHMHDSISLSSPLGQAQGKPQVSDSLAKGFSSGRGGSLGAPYVSGGQIVAPVQSPRGNATMYFGFTDKLVSSLRIR